MKATYNPFNNKNFVETEHGVINYRHDMGTVYVTHRRPEHFFKKYQGFAISITELEVCHQENVHWILIMYTNKAGEQTPHRIRLSRLRDFQIYDNGNDKQVVIPVAYMQKRREEGWEL